MDLALTVNDFLLIAAVVLAAIAVVLLVLVLLRRVPDPTEAVRELALRQAEATEHLERGLRDEIDAHGRGTREELASSIGRFGAQMIHQMGTISTLQNNQIDAFAQQLTRLTESNELRLSALRESSTEDARRHREEIGDTLRAANEVMRRSIAELTGRNDERLSEVRGTLESKLKELQTDNQIRLEEMRRTVDEKLHATLEQRLGESFRQVSERLEQVHKGLGEMQALASDVGDLKRVLTNVKTRGTWGEVQLSSLLEQLLIPDQYAANVATVPGSKERVEYAIRLPGRDPTGDAVLWLPIDAKFPREDYERLLIAQERADSAGAEQAGRQLELRLRAEAKSIRGKYVSPPHTTDFALLFLPTEGLYAEAVRRPGLLDDLQRDHRVVIAGPTTLAAILSSLQMGFRTLAVEKRTSEVWELLGAVKTEFGKFGDMLAKTRRQLQTAANTLGEAEGKTRTIERKMRLVQQLPEPAARRMLADRADGSAPAGPGADVDVRDGPDDGVGAPADPPAA